MSTFLGQEELDKLLKERLGRVPGARAFLCVVKRDIEPYVDAAYRPEFNADKWALAEATVTGTRGTFLNRSRRLQRYLDDTSPPEAVPWLHMQGEQRAIAFLADVAATFPMGEHTDEALAVAKAMCNGVDDETLYKHFPIFSYMAF